jgi:hypothetical protein
MSTITLEQYELAEREVIHRETAVGLRIHALITVLVWAALIPVNIIVAPEFPWAIFPIAGMAIGLFVHWYGVSRYAERDIRRRQRQIEKRAAGLSNS